MIVIEGGILAETVVGENLRAFLSIVDDKCFFGFRKVMTENLTRIEELPFEKALDRIMEFVRNWKG